MRKAIALNDDHAPWFFKGEEYEVKKTYRDKNIDGEDVEFNIVVGSLDVEFEIEEGCPFLKIIDI